MSVIIKPVCITLFTMRRGVGKEILVRYHTSRGSDLAMYLEKLFCQLVNIGIIYVRENDYKFNVDILVTNRFNLDIYRTKTCNPATPYTLPRELIEKLNDKTTLEPLMMRCRNDSVKVDIINRNRTIDEIFGISTKEKQHYHSVKQRLDKVQYENSRKWRIRS